MSCRGLRGNSPLPKSRKRKLSRRGVALIISSMILLMIVIVCGVLYYSYVNKTLGNVVGANPPVTMDNLRFEAYGWQCSTNCNTLILNVRNVGADVLTMSSAQWFVAGVLQTPASSGCAVLSGGTLSPGISCAATITISGVTISTGIVYVVKVVLSDGATFSVYAIAGQVTGQMGVT